MIWLRRLEMSGRPKVFGLGLSKTGTSSLAIALRQMGYRHKSFDALLLADYRKGDLSRLFKNTDKYESFEDWPFSLAFREIMDRYGADARYILTVRRSPDAWLRSYVAHADRKGRTSAGFRKLAYGYEHPRGFENEHIGYYQQHNEAVRAAIQARGLSDRFAELCWERGDGWTQLAQLIGREAPARPFPHANRRPD
jgi:hypothetical protein